MNDEGAERGLARQCRRRDALLQRRDADGRVQPRPDRLAISFGSPQLAGDEHGHVDAGFLLHVQAQRRIEQPRRVDERVAVHDAVSREIGVLQAGHHAEHALLLGELQVRLEPDEVVARALRVFRAQLQRGPGTSSRARVGEPDRFQRPETRRVTARAGDLLDGLARLEQVLRFEIARNDAIGFEQLVDEALVLFLGERRVQVVAPCCARRVFGVFVAALAEQHAHIQRVGHDDGSGGIVESKVIPHHMRKGIGELVACERPRGKDDG